MQVLADVDSPVFLRSSGGATSGGPSGGVVHLTGCFERDPYAEDSDSEDEEGDEGKPLLQSQQH